MKSAIRELDLKRNTFTGIFENYGVKGKYKKISWEALLLTDIKDENGNKLTDRLQLSNNKGFRELGLLTQGELIQFSGYCAYQDKPIPYDLKIYYPNCIKKLLLAEKAFDMFVNKILDGDTLTISEFKWQMTDEEYRKFLNMIKGGNWGRASKWIINWHLRHVTQ